LTGAHEVRRPLRNERDESAGGPLAFFAASAR
jgi:hypothetical protein